MVVEIRDSEFEFYQHNKPTGHYVRGEVINEDELNYEVILFCNDIQYKVDKSICKQVL